MQTILFCLYDGDEPILFVHFLYSFFYGIRALCFFYEHSVDMFFSYMTPPYSRKTVQDSLHNYIKHHKGMSTVCKYFLNDFLEINLPGIISPVYKDVDKYSTAGKSIHKKSTTFSQIPPLWINFYLHLCGFVDISFIPLLNKGFFDMMICASNGG